MPAATSRVKSLDERLCQMFTCVYERFLRILRGVRLGRSTAANQQSKPRDFNDLLEVTPTFRGSERKGETFRSKIASESAVPPPRGGATPPDRTQPWGVLATVAVRRDVVRCDGRGRLRFCPRLPNNEVLGRTASRRGLGRPSVRQRRQGRGRSSEWDVGIVRLTHEAPV